MVLKIEIEIPDDRKYRSVFHPYDIRATELAVDIEQAITNTLDAMQRIDMNEASTAVKQHDNKVGTVKITLE